ncbi:MAG: biopolymer transporter ExbD [Candidatus Eisenbacteria bacterium]|uniref:Biopolymer transporter ExbD n=1 Tax=Eiseniibacteriota bacterium TaxID=2212470 RepID=A0A538T856_UNCEI|nr:MAG: biopolymer transporter ExbD [Candidatus Eisenbacteria bacterium]
MKIRRRAHHHNVIPTASMADIAMLLLIFFLSTTIFKAREALSVRLPGATTGERIRKEESIRLWIGPRGEVAFNDAAVPIERVGVVLASKLESNPRLSIALYADATVPYRTVARVLDEVQRARAPRVMLTTEHRASP